MTAAMFELSADSKTLAQRLREVTVGETVPYSVLSAAIARDVCADGRGALQTARRLVLKEYRMVFDAVRGEGLRRLTDVQIVSLSDKARDHIRRTSRKTARALTCVDYDAMPRDVQTKHNTALSMLGVIGELATEKSQARLASMVEEAGTELPYAKAAIAALAAKV